MVSKARDDLPEPDTPVITVNWLCGSDSEISLRLWTRAPRIRMYSCKLNFSIAVRAKRRGVRRGGSGRCAFLDEQSQFLIKPMESIAYWRYWWRGLRGPELLAVFVTDERQPGSGASAWGSRLDGGDALLQCVQPLVGVVIRDLCMSRMDSNARPSSCFARGNFVRMHRLVAEPFKSRSARLPPTLTSSLRLS